MKVHRGVLGMWLLLAIDFSQAGPPFVTDIPNRRRQEGGKSMFPSFSNAPRVKPKWIRLCSISIMDYRISS
jgi:hypothetical protein